MVKNMVIVVAGAKGGVGKTTTTINLGEAIAEHGHSVVAVEMDLPMPNFVDFLDIDLEADKGSTLPEVLSGQVQTNEAIYETPNGLSVLPSTPNLDEYTDLTLDEFPGIIENLRWYFDIILIDTPAGLSEEATESLEVGDEALIISTPRRASLQNATETIELADRHDSPIRGFILNKSGSGASPGVDAIADSLTVDVLGHVPEDDAVPHSQDLGQPVVVNSPNSGAAIAYQRLARDLLRDDSDQSVGEGPTQDETPSPQSNDDSPESSKPDTDDVSPSQLNSGPETAEETLHDDGRDDVEASTSDDEPQTESSDGGGVTGEEGESPDSPNPSEADGPDGTTPKDEQTGEDGSLVSKVKQLFQSP